MIDSATKRSRIFFVGLDELRAVAAGAVLLSHIELYKHRDGFNSLYDGPLHYFISHLGKNGVYLFFVLSGFLITYLLLKEQERTGSIRLRAFYARRVLRIWPVYYVVVGIGFIVVPRVGNSPFFLHEQHYATLVSQLTAGTNLALHLVFLSNLALLLYPAVVGASQSWSVSVEEQFYAFWPLMLRFARKRPWLSLLAVIVVKLVLVRVLALLNARIKSAGLTIALRLFEEMRFELMALGGLAAWLLTMRATLVERWAGSRWGLLGTVLLIAASMLRYSHPFLLGVGFACLVLQVITHRLSLPPLQRIGKISYGVYMYHPLCMFLCFALINNAGIRDGWWRNVLAYGGIVGLTLLLSSLSYRYLEAPFLRLKERFEVIASGRLR